MRTRQDIITPKKNGEKKKPTMEIDINHAQYRDVLSERGLEVL